MMYYDIVGSLPLELLVQIVGYLDLKDIVRNQRVCTYRAPFDVEVKALNG